MEFTDIGRSGNTQIDLAQDTDQLRTIMETVMNFGAPLMLRNS
jgi:hypothetical protein